MKAVQRLNAALRRAELAAKPGEPPSAVLERDGRAIALWTSRNLDATAEEILEAVTVHWGAMAPRALATATRLAGAKAQPVLAAAVELGRSRCNHARFVQRGAPGIAPDVCCNCGADL